jgi:NAD+ diphosphatase
MPFFPETSAAPKHDRRTWVVVHPKGLVARRGDDGVSLVFPTDEEIATFAVANLDEERHRLGTLDATDVFVLPIDAAVVPSPPLETFTLRAMAAFLTEDLFAVVGRGMHASDWLTTTRFCGRCGTKTNRSAQERCAICPRCDLHFYPRISPAIITLVRRGEQALLANNAKFPGAFYSTLAGFADIGESLEETLIREVKEEVGIDVTNVRYFGSQPWPFPNSLMIGFDADYAGGEIAIDQSEIADARWFSYDELPQLPGPLSIARKLIDAWVTEMWAKRG